MRKKTIVLKLKYYLLGCIFITLLSCNLNINCGSDKFFGRGERYRCGGAYDGTSPSMSRNGKKIVFGSTRYGLGDIIIINSDGKGWQRLTDTPAYEGEPSFSPDGRRIVFVSERNDNGKIYIMNSDGSEQVRLTISDSYNGIPSFSPDGTKMVFARVVWDETQKTKRSQIFIMNVDGTNQKRLTFGCSWAGAPSFSPDGKKIIFVCSKDGSDFLGIMDVKGSNVIRLVDGPVFSVPSFSPEGNMIVYMAESDNKGNIDMHIMDLQEKKSKHIKALKKGDYSIEHPTFIDSGRKIMFYAARSEKGGEICTINLDGSGLNVISNSN